MKMAANWSELLTTAGPDAVEPVRRLRNGAGNGTFQYFEHGEEKFAVHGTRPYGALTGVDRPDLLRLEDTGSDYSIFDVQEDTLSLKAITLGTGRRNTDLLRRTYGRVGSALGSMIGEMRVPLLGVADFAIVRPSGDVLFLPPVQFGEGTNDPGEHSQFFAASLHRAFTGPWAESDVQELSSIVASGVRNALRG